MYSDIDTKDIGETLDEHYDVLRCGECGSTNVEVNEEEREGCFVRYHGFLQCLEEDCGAQS